jgi:phosphopantothenoylcysteine decarboxylase/phosphopantothenate--cysteine ligase
MIRALVTAGPTHEPIDAVRFIGNRSSGRMALAIARSLADQGCRVTLLAGPGIDPAGSVETAPDRVRRFTTADDLGRLLAEEWPSHDLLVMAAAVADFKPAHRTEGTLRRDAAVAPVELVPTGDLLAGLAATTRPDQFVVGFALEDPAELERSAQDKLARKRADVIVANPLATMDSADVDATLFLRDGRVERPADRPIPKPQFAAWLAARILPDARARLARGGPATLSSPHP